MKNLAQGSSCRGPFGRGIVESIVTSGPVLGVPDPVTGSPEAPAARVRVYSPLVDGWMPTARHVGALLAQLAPTIEFRAPRTPFSEPVDKARLGALEARQARPTKPLAPAPADHPVRTAPLTVRYCDPASAGFIGYVESADRSWIGFVGDDGLGILYPKRTEDGATAEAPLLFNRAVATLHPQRGFERDLGGDAVHTDGPMKKTVRHGVEYVLDRPKGSVRSGFDENGQAYETTMTCDYGYHPGTRGGDNKPIDAYVGEHESAKEVHIVNQVRSDGTDDEQKVMVDHRDMLEACRVWHDHTPSRYFGGCFTMSVREYKSQLRAAMKDPSKAFRFTHAASPEMVSPEDEDEGTDSQRSRALVTGGAPVLPPPPPAPAAPAVPRVQLASEADLARLESGFEVSFVDALFLREGRAISGGIRESTREVDCVMSDERVDSYGTILRCNWDLRRFVGALANPVLLWMHNRREDLPPVGTVKDVRKDPAKVALVGTACFDDTSPFDEVIWQKYRKGVLRGFSVGFNPRQARLEVVGNEEVLVFDDIELTELSCAAIPSNAGALALEARQRVMTLARAAGGRLEIPEGIRAAVEASERTRVVVPADIGVRADPALAGTTPQIAPSAPRAAPVEEAAAPVVRDVGDDEAGEGDEARAAIPYQKTPIVDIEWDEAAARKALAAWATTEGTLDRKMYARGFAYEDKADDTLEAFKLPHHTLRDGKLVCVRNALSAAVGAINGARGSKVKIPDADLPRVKKHIAKHYKDDGLASPWEDKGEKRTPQPGESPVTLKKLEKTGIRAMGDGSACIAVCAHCNGEVEIAHADLPENPLTRAAITVAGQEKTAAEQRAVAFETANRIMGDDLVRHMLTIATRDVDALIGLKLDPTERDTELDLARTLITSYTTRVPVDATKAAPTDPHEYDGFVRWQARVVKLKARNDIGLLGRSVVPRDPTRPNLTPSAVAGAGQPQGGPPVPAGAAVRTESGRTMTTGGASLAAAVEAAAAKPPPAPLPVTNV